ncbi:hypothetical protein BT96DRAFT_928151 [Gymnopus androsaceus JB14]|uniref:Uncharacterized protein n=1 Tax=Gymnopus androsaceus JB14 TaxID=1447944 RepID=A0A6A4GMF6_9AGAR|nr:hypothetical protein BT96DRAFT_928151 [Gymnopus androsaceus JB14]
MSKLILKSNKTVFVGIGKAEHEKREISEEEPYSDAGAGVEAEGPDPEGYPRVCRRE